mmetsp:Transcript_12309/g.14568  ORF Transcript_12309/g.14568 Transcript_12309/m.14568 type:complete len:86 (+) Transcript_12309:2295-2552(+)
MRRRLLSLQLVGSPGVLRSRRNFLETCTARRLRDSLLAESYTVASLLGGDEQGKDFSGFSRRKFLRKPALAPHESSLVLMRRACR